MQCMMYYIALMLFFCAFDTCN